MADEETRGHIILTCDFLFVQPDSPSYPYLLSFLLWRKAFISFEGVLQFVPDMATVIFQCLEDLKSLPIAFQAQVPFQRAGVTQLHSAIAGHLDSSLPGFGAHQILPADFLHPARLLSLEGWQSQLPQEVLLFYQTAEYRKNYYCQYDKPSTEFTTSDCISQILWQSAIVCIIDLTY